MCDENTLRDGEDHLRRSGNLNRRDFGALSLGTGLAMALPRAADALQVTAANVDVPTPDGVADCHFVHPSDGTHPGVLIWPDALGLRPAFEQMGQRLAESGYAVLVVNPYYRKVKAPVLPEGASFRDEATRNTIFPLMRSLGPEITLTDARAFVGFLDGQAVVADDRKMATTGYCMGGSMTMRTAAAFPDRIGAGASFHGGRLVTDGPESPHHLVGKMRAHYLFAIAENDDEKDPEAKSVLREAFAAAGLPAEIEVYEGALHGWCPPDSAVYNEAQAERAWSRMLALFERALA
ncbi:MAG: dienelactone hydrolase family protein [Rhodobacteraceae bacterium]|nr:dienelactone hydrolase family protein [Paracoccaceae bacterium]MCY4141622.1 dienelactone hydrolase family protein [Paracoccaceae bacterium]